MMTPPKVRVVEDSYAVSFLPPIVGFTALFERLIQVIHDVLVTDRGYTSARIVHRLGDYTLSAICRNFLFVDGDAS